MSKSNREEKTSKVQNVEENKLNNQNFKDAGAETPCETKQERGQTASFAVSEQTKQMFDLLLLMTGENADDVFERMVGRYAYRVVKHRAGKGKCGYGHGHNHGCGGRRHAFGHAHGHDHGMGMGFGHGKAFGRIPLWSRRPGQFSHRIIKSFFRTEKDGVAMRDDMYGFFVKHNPEVTRAQFDGNLNNMGTEGGNSHGHVFDFQNGEVRLAEQVAERLKSFKEKFIKDEQ